MIMIILIHMIQLFPHSTYKILLMEVLLENKDQNLLQLELAEVLYIEELD